MAGSHETLHAVYLGIILLVVIVAAAAFIGAEIWRSVRWRGEAGGDVPRYLRRRG